MAGISDTFSPKTNNNRTKLELTNTITFEEMSSKANHAVLFPGAQAENSLQAVQAVQSSQFIQSVQALSHKYLTTIIINNIDHEPIGTATSSKLTELMGLNKGLYSHFTKKTSLTISQYDATDAIQVVDVQHSTETNMITSMAPEELGVLTVMDLNQSKVSDWDRSVIEYVQFERSNGRPVFTCFRKLLPELRLRIWKFMFPTVRRITLCPEVGFRKIKGRTVCTVPITLQICYESRRETLRTYPLLREVVQSGYKIPQEPLRAPRAELYTCLAIHDIAFNPMTYVVEVDFFQFCCTPLTVALEEVQKKSPRFLESISQVVLRYVEPKMQDDPAFNIGDARRARRNASYFPNLITLTLHYSAGWGRGSNPPKTPDYKVRKAWLKAILAQLKKENTDFKIEAWIEEPNTQPQSTTTTINA